MARKKRVETDIGKGHPAPMTNVISFDENDANWRRMGRAIRFLSANYLDHPTLEDAAGAVGLSPFHFQRVFTRYVGVSPKNFVGHLTLDNAKESLVQGKSLLGTKWQIQVWQALLAIPDGKLSSYGAIAAHLGKDTAARAVGAAVGRNPIAWIIPCHRVLGSSGALTGYHWGVVRKRAMLAVEAAKAHAADARSASA